MSGITNQMTILQKRREQHNKHEKDVRTEYDRDEARVIHSPAFRRLQSKTQVLGLGESDFYRTRLTHSMEVAQIGRGIVQFLSADSNSKYQQYLPCASLISAICLAHDIGHPPFGHGGEVALNYCMREYGGFEGNGQTLRILGKLDKYTVGYGINPTRRMLLGVLKYPASYEKCVNTQFYEQNEICPQEPYWLFKAEFNKPPKCYHKTDQDIVDFIFDGFEDKDVKIFTEIEQTKSHAKSLYKSLDCSIMNLADNISYSLHDLEDALSLGMISKQDWDAHFQEHTHLFDDFISKVKQIHEEDNFSYEQLVQGLFGESSRRKRSIGALVNYMITNTEIYDVGNGCEHFLLTLNVKLSDEAEQLRDKIFSLVKIKVINDVNVQQLEFKGQKVIVELFQAISKDPERFLPETTKKRWKAAIEAEQTESAGKRVICDYISGMTDDYATRLYEKIYTPTKGSIFERL
ncbi:anti-phage deoxyguanosine triphosphatase [Neptuniibacter sp. QD48_11]|uniref:anti-phage deoxyguanosine triphosphatase n=1 Tax=Neptuniibacter sp. QD48_11 TaxID=3398211 RepID=UPI0039F62F8E